MSSRRLMFIVLSVVLFLFACNILEGSLSNQDQMSTQVAGTMTSRAPDEVGLPTATTPLEAISPATETLPPGPGLKIAYTDGGNIWLIDGDSPPQQLTSSGNAENILISSDGVKISFTRRPSPDSLAELRVVNADGSGETVLLSIDDMIALYPSTLESKGFEIGQMAFLPGTHALLFTTFEAFETVGLAMTDDLLRIETDSGDLTRLLPPDSGGHFVISPDGNHIIVIRPDSINRVGPGGSGLVSDILTYIPVITYSEFQYYAQPVWSQDSSAVGIAIPSDDPLAGSPTGFIFRMDNDGSSVINVGTISGDFYFSQVFSSASLSPNLSRVAFLRDTGTPNTRDLFLANADGTGEILYDSGDIGWLGWAPDGIHFVYSLSGPMNMQLGTDGSPASPLATGIDLCWINSSEYLYLSGSLGSWTLQKGELGMAPIPLANPSGDFISYDFTQ